MNPRAKLVVLYKDMYEHTKQECGTSCRVPHSCCSGEYCLFTIEHAKNNWGVILAPTDHPNLPLMGPNGCTADPHLRPMCTMHTCDINGVGFKPGDEGWTIKYFRIRNKIADLEAQIEPDKV